MFRGVTFPRDHLIFQIFPLLIFNLEGTSIRRDNVDFQFAVGAIELGIGGMVGNAVLIAYIIADLMKNLRELSLESRKVGAAARKRAKVVISLSACR